MGKFVRISLYSLFLVAFSWVSAQLFFEKQTDQLMASVSQTIFEDENEIKTELDELKVVYYDEASTLEPLYTDDPAIWKRLINIYEPLIKLDRDLKLKPVLALSWGLIDDKTWEFNLRRDVRFHDGTTFDADDVVASFNRAFTFGRFDTVVEVQKVDDYRLIVKTKKPDPLLLHNIATFPIIPAENEKQKAIEIPVGTGPYKFESWKKNEKMILKRFEDYWDKLPKFKTVEIIYQSGTVRVNMVISGEADLIDFVPYDSVEALKKRDLPIVGIPSLQVEFLLFNFNSAFARERENREVVSLLVDLDFLDQAFGDYVRKVNQFVSNGTFGFNPKIADHEHDFEKAKQLIEKNSLEGKLVQIHLPLGLEFLGEYLRGQLSLAGLAPIVSYLENDRLLQSMQDGKADVYFLGYRANLGDAAGFFEAIVRSGANFNLTKYSNADLDELIEATSVEMDQKKRLELLQQAMKILVDDEIFGVPLIEYETLYTFSDKIELTPRIDGFIYFDDLKIK